MDVFKIGLVLFCAGCILLVVSFVAKYGQDIYIGSAMGFFISAVYITLHALWGV